jgi:hypothetical protein
MARVHEAPYLLRSWVYLLHPFLVFTAALGVALAVQRRAPVLAVGAMSSFLLWAFNEAGQQSLTLFAFDRWRRRARRERSRLSRAGGWRSRGRGRSAISLLRGVTDLIRG